jgi:hypothetical protein
MVALRASRLVWDASRAISPVAASMLARRGAVHAGERVARGRGRLPRHLRDRADGAADILGRGPHRLRRLGHMLGAALAMPRARQRLLHLDRERVGGRRRGGESAVQRVDEDGDVLLEDLAEIDADAPALGLQQLEEEVERDIGVRKQHLGQQAELLTPHLPLRFRDVEEGRGAACDVVLEEEDVAVLRQAHARHVVDDPALVRDIGGVAAVGEYLVELDEFALVGLGLAHREVRLAESFSVAALDDLADHWLQNAPDLIYRLAFGGRVFDDEGQVAGNGGAPLQFCKLK